mgnify:CR=1 FL=1
MIRTQQTQEPTAENLKANWNEFIDIIKKNYREFEEKLEPPKEVKSLTF